MIGQANERGDGASGVSATPGVADRRGACLLAARLLVAASVLGSCESITDKYEFAPAAAADGDGGDAAGDGVASDAFDGRSADSGGGTDGSDSELPSDVGDGSDSGGDADAAVDGGSDGAVVDAGPAVTIECNVAADCGKTVDDCTFYACLAQLCVLKSELDGVKCDDKFACTSGELCKAGACKSPSVLGCACFQDADCAASGSPCAGKPYCDKSGADPACKVNPATVVTCSKAQDNECQTAVCSDLTGACVLQPTKPTGGGKIVVCEDGSPCTGPDSCANGKCIAGANACGCTSHLDCKGKGDACTGDLYCDVLSDTPTCIPNPLNVVDCKDPEDPCATSACDPKTGACVNKPKTENTACDDGNPCTSDSCVQGVCTPGTNICGCKQDADCAGFEDVNPCNGVNYCNKAAAGGASCKVNPSTVIVCSEAGDSDCKTAYCSPSTGKCGYLFSDKFSLCNADGDPCTEKDGCDGKGTCEPGTNTCSCQKDADCAPSDDEDICNGKHYCDITQSPAVCKVNPKTVVTCPQPAAGVCLEAVCDGKTGGCSQIALGDSTPCQDGKPCTTGDDCQGGKCVPGTDFCACATDADCIGDGDLCNGIEYCQKSATGKQCKPKLGSQVQCLTGKTGECLVNACQPSTGACVATPKASNCDDGKACTVDLCDSAGKCLHGPVVSGSACASAGTGSQICADTACVAAIDGMKWVGGGVGYLGCSPADTQCAPSEGKATEVTLDGYWIDRREVSVADYAACAKVGQCSSLPGVGVNCNWQVAGREKHPVNCVNHAQATAYCFAHGKRLPTEAEWERAARGGCATVSGDCATETPIVPWAGPVVSCEFTVMMGENEPGCDLGGTAPVASWPKDDSPYGVRDLGGNIAEWTSNVFVADLWQGKPLTNPKNLGTGARTVRGGAYTSAAVQVRSSGRSSQPTTASLATIGFRCAKSQP